jgi:hypothetical protein
MAFEHSVHVTEDLYNITDETCLQAINLGLSESR